MTNDTTQVSKEQVQGRRRLTGVVVSHAPKTAVVAVQRSVMHPVYRKAYRTHKKYHAHDAKDVAKIGDKVTIEAARSMSARKRWRIV